jgi:hypothetical protein
LFRLGGSGRPFFSCHGQGSRSVIVITGPTVSLFRAAGGSARAAVLEASTSLVAAAVLRALFWTSWLLREPSTSYAHTHISVSDISSPAAALAAVRARGRAVIKVPWGGLLYAAIGAYLSAAIRFEGASAAVTVVQAPLPGMPACDLSSCAALMFTSFYGLKSEAAFVAERVPRPLGPRGTQLSVAGRGTALMYSPRFARMLDSSQALRAARGAVAVLVDICRAAGAPLAGEYGAGLNVYLDHGVGGTDSASLPTLVSDASQALATAAATSGGDVSAHAPFAFPGSSRPGLDVKIIYGRGRALADFCDGNASRSARAARAVDVAEEAFERALLARGEPVHRARAVSRQGASVGLSASYSQFYSSGLHELAAAAGGVRRGASAGGGRRAGCGTPTMSSSSIDRLRAACSSSPRCSLIPSPIWLPIV